MADKTLTMARKYVTQLMEKLMVGEEPRSLSNSSYWFFSLKGIASCAAQEEFSLFVPTGSFAR